MSRRPPLTVSSAPRLVVARAVCVVFIGLMASCTDGAATPPPATTPAPLEPSATPSITTRSSARPVKQPLEQQVLALVKRYYEVDEAIATDREVSLNRYYEVAGGEYAAELLAAAQRQRRLGHRVTGKVGVGRFHIEKLRDSKTQSNATAIVRVCLDVSAVEVVNEQGKSVVEDDRADAYLERLHLRHASRGWRVFDADDSETPTCEP